MKIRDFLAAATLCLSAASAQASTVLMPTDGDVNVFIEIGSLGLQTCYSLALFDDSVSDVFQMSTADRLDIASNQIVGFSGPVTGGDFIATGTLPVDTLTLSGSNNFILGITDGTDWFMDIGIGSLSLGANSQSISFGGSNEVFLTDVTASVVPLPAALWLFGAGLIGLAGIARRRK